MTSTYKLLACQVHFGLWICRSSYPQSPTDLSRRSLLSAGNFPATATASTPPDPILMVYNISANGFVAVNVETREDDFESVSFTVSDLEWYVCLCWLLFIQCFSKQKSRKKT